MKIILKRRHSCHRKISLHGCRQYCRHFSVLLLCAFLFVSCTKNISRSLSPLQGAMTVHIYQYNGQKINSDSIFNDFSSWKIAKVRGEKDAWDISGNIEGNGCGKPCQLSVEFSFKDWNKDNYVFAPAALYNGNRFRVLPLSYPPYIYNKEERPLDMPITISNVPHLNINDSISRIDMLTSNCSSPLVGFYDKRHERGFFIQTLQGNTRGNDGFVIKENPMIGEASFSLTTPAVRELRYTMCNLSKSNDSAAVLRNGEKLGIRLRCYQFHAPTLMAFYDKFFSIRKALSGQNMFIDRAPFSYISETILAHHDKNKWFENSDYGYICNHPDSNSPFGHLQLGWNGAPVYSLTQLLLPTAERTRRICRTFDTIEKMQGHSGLFYGMFRIGKLYGDNFYDMEKEPQIAMIRRSGLTLYFGLQCLDVMKKEGNGNKIKPEWDDMFRRCADALVTLWNRYGQFGQHVNAETGEITTNNSTAGAINIAALAYASQYFKESEYLRVAEAAAEYYYNRDLKKGYVGGGPAEILQCPDSESSAELTESFISLYELTREKRFLSMAREAAALFSSWVVSYDYKFPKGSDMDRVDAKVTGSVWASVQNEHSAPGIYILSGDFLFKLYRSTGDRRYIDLLKDIAHNVVQYVTTKENPIGIGSPYGAVSERVNISDWEGSDAIGMIVAGDTNMAWENVALLSVMQNPGIYVQKDKHRVFVIDHVKARLISNDELEIANDTPNDAMVTLFIESSKEAKKDSLGWNNCLTWRKIFVKAGQTIRKKVDRF
jgi:hypothetical protein